MKLSKDKINGFVTEFELVKKIVEENCDGLVMDNSRHRNNVIARMALANILLKKNYTSTAIGTFMNKDHTTVLHYRRELYDLCKTDSRLKSTYEESLKIYESCTQSSNYKKPHEDELTEEIKKLEESEAELKSQINVLNLRLESKLHKESRLNNIIDIVIDRTRRGTECLVEEKIKRFYNGVYER